MQRPVKKEERLVVPLESGFKGEKNIPAGRARSRAKAEAEVDRFFSSSLSLLLLSLLRRRRDPPALSLPPSFFLLPPRSRVSRGPPARLFGSGTARPLSGRRGEDVGSLFALVLLARNGQREILRQQKRCSASTSTTKSSRPRPPRPYPASPSTRRSCVLRSSPLTTSGSTSSR